MESLSITLLILQTLSAIAKNYGTTVSAIQKLNPSLIKNVNLINIGWKIRVK